VETDIRELERDGIVLEAERARRYEAHLSVLMVNIDGLGVVNEKIGREAGDMVLRETAALIRRNTRRIDVVGRWDQEDFAILTVDRNVFGSVAMAEKLRRLISQHPFEWAGRPFKVTCSIGVARGTPETEPEIDRLLESARAAVLRAKASGRNRIEYSGEGAGLSPDSGSVR
jgi:diguanylate cyclase (GGDEF)-like protein